MTTIEAGLVSRIRNKIGDNPTTVVVNPITAATHSGGIVTVTVRDTHELPDGLRLSIRGVLGMTDLNSNFDIFNVSQKTFDVGLTTAQTYLAAGLYNVINTELEIWSDSEFLEALTSGVNQMFKAKKTLDELDDFEVEFVLLRTNIDLVHQLGINSARYSKYVMKDVNAQKVDPSEFIKEAESLEKRLKDMILELDDEDAGSVISQSVFRVEDREEDIMIDIDMEPDVDVPKFTLTSVATGVQVDIFYKFIASYKTHFIKQIDEDGVENIIKEFYTVVTENFIDTTVISGKTYRYILYVKTLNGYLFESELSIDYATP